MHPVKPCQTYHGLINGRDLLRGRGDKTAETLER